ncbi:hypothetical protein Vadar_028149 [Vaccinium darrowii]|uniref:Uncharacterized protein n=1 Tax=Vaccinium darrowii TaxID=229202 RepID=A0ACB7XCX8_9ERIC|nr:hypothetical protein Vadar_028149 [Vaccinium darrowii]
MKDLVGSNVGGAGRSAEEKEKTKMRERQRRSITTKIFHGLRKHGGYRLSPRADINEVLRELAAEAGWVIDPDGTTYRRTFGPNACPLCGTGQRSSTPTPTSSLIVGGGDSIVRIGGPTSLYNNYSASSGAGASSSCDTYRILTGGLDDQTSAAACGGGTTVAYDHRQRKLMYFQEARESNQNTPAGSPLRHV